MCPGPSRPERFRPQGFPPSRRFPRTLVLRSPHPSPLGAGLHAAAVKDLFRLLQGSPLPQESPSPSGVAGSLVVRVGAAFECDPSCPDLPGLPPTPASFRPTTRQRRRVLPRASSSGADLGAVAGLPPGLERRFHRDPRLRLGPDFLVTRRHGEPCSPSRRSVDLGAFFLPRARPPPRRRHRLLGRDPPGVRPLQSLDPDSASGPD